MVLNKFVESSKRVFWFNAKEDFVGRDVDGFSFGGGKNSPFESVSDFFLVVIRNDKSFTFPVAGVGSCGSAKIAINSCGCAEFSKFGGGQGGVGEPVGINVCGID